MNNNKCKNLKIKLNHSFECKLTNKIINIKQCNKHDCKNYECKSNNHQIKNKTQSCTLKDNKKQNYSNMLLKSNKPSKRTKALAISKQVKLIVWERDNRQCIFCHCPVPWNLANSHFVKRSHSGLGIPENIFCACLECHHDFDDTPKRTWMIPIARNYLMNKYNDWNENDLIYKKTRDTQVF